MSSSASYSSPHHDDSPYSSADDDSDFSHYDNSNKRKYDHSLENDNRRRYEVFLSFRGQDTRASFTSHLTSALQNAGIIVFKDDHSLIRGDPISAKLRQAIENSEISIIVFSKNYADSPWCLDELTQIMECHRTIGQVVLPIFYDVYPSDVRRQSREFGKAFQDLLNTNIVQGDHTELNWVDALREAAGLSGFVVLNSRLLSSSLCILLLCLYILFYFCP